MLFRMLNFGSIYNLGYSVKKIRNIEINLKTNAISDVKDDRGYK